MINEDLLRELEKRDQAVHEAVSLICELENQVTAVRSRNSDGRPCTSESDHRPGSGSESQSQFIVPAPRIQAVVSDNPTPRFEDSPYQEEDAPTISIPAPDNVPSPTSPKSPWRTPSFFWEKKSSTRALRGLYQDHESPILGNSSLVSLPRPGSLFGRDEYQDDGDPDTYTLNSPRLSMLSESSFRSVYGNPKDLELTPGNALEDIGLQSSPPAEGSSPTQIPTQREVRLHKWIDERNKSSTPNQPTPRSGFSSIGEVLQKVPSGPQDEQYNQSPTLKHCDMHPPKHSRQGLDRLAQLPSSGGRVFGHDMLPPTPDTMSTTNRDANSSTYSVITEKSLLDGKPYPLEPFSTLFTESQSYLNGMSDAFKPNNALAFDADADLADLVNSDDELDSVQVEQSESVDLGDHQGSPQEPNFLGGSSSAMQSNGLHPPTRPSLTAYGTNMIFNGEGYYDSVNNFRAMSYPSPTALDRGQSVQFSPTSTVKSGVLSPNDYLGGGSSTVTPTKPDRSRESYNSPPSLQRTISATPSNEFARRKSPSINSKTSRSPSTRPYPSKTSRSATDTLPPTQIQTFTSRIFRRSNSQGIQPPSQTQTATSDLSDPGILSLPQTKRTISSTFSKTRPTSLHLRSKTTHPLSSTTDAATSMRPSRIARPGTAGGASQSSSTQPPHYIPTTTRTSGTFTIADNGGMDTFATDQEDGLADSRLTTMNTTVAVNEKEGGRKWAAAVGGVGRSASLRIKEGVLGRTRRGEKGEK